MSAACPKCGFADPGAECPHCGVIVAKWRAGVPPAGPPAPPPAIVFEDDDAPSDGRLGPTELKILAFGLIAALVVNAIGILRFLVGHLEVLFHELGHTIVGWLLGHPGIPAFDFFFGGGFTHQTNFKLPLALLVAAGFGWLAWRMRHNPRALIAIGAAFALWLFCVSSEWRRETAISFAGPAFSLVMGAVFLYMALANVGFRIPEIERPLGAFIAFFVQIYGMQFALRLMNDADYLAWYQEGKGGAIMNDLEVVALDLHIHTPLNPGIRGVAAFLFAFSFVPIGVAVGWYLNRARMHRLKSALMA